MQFNSIQAFCAHVAASIMAMEVKENYVLEHIGQVVEAKSKAIIGEEDVAGLNGFESHEPLADSTIEYKEDHGYTGRVSATDPLLREGDLYHSITHVVDLPNHAVVVGSGLDYAVEQELGTSKMPPRSFLGIAAEQARPEIEELGIEIAVTLIKR